MPHDIVYYPQSLQVNLFCGVNVVQYDEDDFCEDPNNPSKYVPTVCFIDY